MPATQTPPRLISIGRIASRKIKNGNSDILETVITYVPGADGSKTALVASYQNGTDAAYSYTYDANGNITEITQGTASFTYEYDKANQLVRENLYYGSGNSNNATYTYEYDAWGNILNKKKYAYTTGTLGSVLNTKTYGYTNTQWGDLLTSYNGSTITYDAMGNMASYGSKTYSWEGKQLVGISLLGAANYTFSYDENGLRTSKTLTWVSDNTSVATEYYYNGSVLIGMKTGSTVMRFSYGASGNVVSVDYSEDNGATFTTYYYLRNAQSDIVKLIDGSGNTVVEYTYDSWGKLLSVTGSLSGTLGEDQPLRYRGYVYDSDTQLYYLQSRYYDPKIGRFISADVLLSTGQGVIGHNSFAYCGNNPNIRSDPSGCRWFEDFVEWVEGVAEEAAHWVSNTFGVEKQVEFTHESIKATTIFGDVEYGESASTRCGDSCNKPFVFYFKAASARWKVWEYSVGVKANVIDGGGAVEIGLEHTNFSLSAGKTTYTVNGGVNRLGITIANDVDWKNNTAGNYTQYYIRPITVVPAAVGVCAAVSYVGPAVIGTLAALLSGTPALLPA